MKLVFGIIGWAGLVMVIPALLPSFSSSWFMLTAPDQMGSDGYWMTAVAGSLGVVLAVIGGGVARPKYFWVGATVVGVLYIISFCGAAVYSISRPGYILYVLLTISPAILLLALAILLRNIARRERKAA